MANTHRYVYLCKLCEVEFFTARKGQIYCSNSCSKKGTMDTKYRYFKGDSRSYELKICPTCKKETWIDKNGLYCSRECRRKPTTKMYLLERKLYHHYHYEVRKSRGKADSCVNGCKTTRYEWANLTEQYDNIYDYISMCTACHNRFDTFRVAVVLDKEKK